MPARPQPPRPPAEPADAPAAEQQAAPEASHAERLYRAQSVELETLRRRLEDVPDPDTLATLRDKAQRFDELSSQLPQWKEQLAATFQAEQAALRQRAQEQEQQLEAARFETTASGEFARAGGRAEVWGEFRAMVGDRLQRGEDGAVLLDGQPFGQRFAELVGDPYGITASFARPAYGSGSGGRSARDGRAIPARGMSLRDGKAELFKAGFGATR